MSWFENHAHSMIVGFICTVIGVTLGLGLGTKITDAQARANEVSSAISESESSAITGSIIPLPNGENAIIAKDSVAKIRIKGTVDNGSRTIDSNGESKSIGATSSGDKIDEQLKFDKSNLSLGDMFGTTGASSFKAKIVSNPGICIVIMLGVALIIGGILCMLWLKLPGLGFALIAAGIVTVIIGVLIQSAVWVFVLAGIIGLGVLGWLLWSSYLSKFHKTVATTVTNGVEDGDTISPADLPMIVDPAKYAEYQLVINGAITALKTKIQKRSEAAKGVVAKFLGK